MTAPPTWLAPDRRLRMRAGELANVKVEHLETFQDAAVLEDARPAPYAGSTEWHGHHGGTVVSIAWDWSGADDGDVRIVQAVSPRTNLQLLDAKGYDLPEAEAAAVLWRYIECRPWQQHVRAALK